MKEWLLVFIRGLFMGMADIVPGVSGGTIALITGIYERLIFALKGLNVRFLLYLIRGDWENTKKHLFSMDLKFLLTLFAGIMTAFFILSRVIRFLMAEHPANTYAFFFGLILASAGFVYKFVGKLELKVIIAGVLGFLFAFMFVGIETLQSTHTLPVIFISGMVAVCAMVLPGISGAFILFFLGQYEYMLNMLLMFDVPTVATFMAGAVIGLVGIARVLTYLLKNHKSMTMSFLLGLMLGALRMPYENILTNTFYIPAVIACGVAGFAVVVTLEKTADRISVEKD